ncbi:MAG TPA: GMC family oxidoreductase [Vicinamibacterales bacterium]|nr:GMC family oxidoreductase [Vicinamibacterales bacterium]
MLRARQDRADVVVIGSGAAGAALTWRLATRGASVVCLEQGDWLRPGDFASERHDCEASLRRGPYTLFPNDRGRPEDYPVTTSGAGPSAVVMWNGVGGSTVHWEGHFPRFHPSDFAVRQLDGVADDWPITYADLEPFYDVNDSMIGVSGLAGDPANPRRSARTTPPLPLGRSGEALVRGFETLGWHWWPSDNAIISRDYNGRTGCDNRGRCNFGCPLKAKASADIVYWPHAIRAGARLMTRSRVQEITVAVNGRVSGVRYFDGRGALHELPARVVVLCGNGIGTPRLLLASRSKFFPDGLANSSGNVGKYFMNHPSRYIEGIFDEPFEVEAFTGNPFFSQQFYETDRTRSFLRGYSMMVYRPFGPASVAWGDSEPVPWGRGHHQEMARRFGHSVGIAVMAEDLPEPINRVDLDDDAKDSSGIPAARVTYRAGENTTRMLGHGAASARQVLEAAGAARILDSGRVGNFAHYMGTARMGHDPERSVVNSWHQAHAVANLFIVDGSSFTTSAGVNPTSTIGALALRAAEGIWSRRGEWT